LSEGADKVCYLGLIKVCSIVEYTDGIIEKLKC
jgi:hypothetical protein